MGSLSLHTLASDEGSVGAADVGELRTAVGADVCKGSIETLVPGFTRSWAPMPHEHPIIV